MDAGLPLYKQEVLLQCMSRQQWKIPNSNRADPWCATTHVCNYNPEYEDDWCEGGDRGCDGRCRPKEADGTKCVGEDSNSCRSGHCRGITMDSCIVVIIVMGMGTVNLTAIVKG